jgi:hypothetical protein
MVEDNIVANDNQIECFIQHGKAHSILQIWIILLLEDCKNKTEEKTD